MNFGFLVFLSTIHFVFTGFLPPQSMVHDLLKAVKELHVCFWALIRDEGQPAGHCTIPNTEIVFKNEKSFVKVIFYKSVTDH